MCVCMQMYVCIIKWVFIRVYMYVCICTCVYVCKCMCVYVCVYTYCVCVHTYVFDVQLTRTDTRRRRQTRTDTCRHALTHTDTRKHRHTPTHSDTHKHKRSRTHKHASTTFSNTSILYTLYSYFTTHRYIIACPDIADPFSQHSFPEESEKGISLYIPLSNICRFMRMLTYNMNIHVCVDM